MKTRQTVFRRVKKTFIRTAPRLLHLTLVKGGKAEKISTTKEHPFYVTGKGFVEAGNLKAGMVIEQVSSPKNSQLMALSRENDSTGSLLSRWLAQVGSWVTYKWGATAAIAAPMPLVVKSLTYGKTPTTVYNFEVEATHTYVVGKSQALVHNADYPKPLTSKEIRAQRHHSTSADYPKHTQAHSRNDAIEKSRRGDAQYWDDGLGGNTNFRNLIEKEALRKGDRLPPQGNKGSYYYIYDAGKTIGYNLGRPVQYLRVEVTKNGVYHGHPINNTRYRGYLRNIRNYDRPF